MLISCDGGAYTLRITDYELALIAEGIYAVRDAGRRCIESGSADEVDRKALEAEIDVLGDMLRQLESAQEQG